MALLINFFISSHHQSHTPTTQAQDDFRKAQNINGNNIILTMAETSSHLDGKLKTIIKKPTRKEINNRIFFCELCVCVTAVVYTLYDSVILFVC